MIKFSLNYSFLRISKFGLSVILLLLTQIFFSHSITTRNNFKEGLSTKAITFFPTHSEFKYTITSNLCSPHIPKLFTTKNEKNRFHEFDKPKGNTKNKSAADLIIKMVASRNQMNRFTFTSTIYSLFINHFFEAIYANTENPSLRQT
jgi:hypothetical protein